MAEFHEVELQAALMAALMADAPFLAACPGGVWDGPPASAGFPRAVLADLAPAADNTGRLRGSRVAVSFEVEDRPRDPDAPADVGGAVRARRVAAAMRAALEWRPDLLTIPGAHVWAVEFAGSTVGAPDLDGVAGRVAFVVSYHDN